MVYMKIKICAYFQIAIKREEAVTREITRKYADDKKISKKEKDEKYVQVTQQLTNCIMLFTFS